MKDLLVANGNADEKRHQYMIKDFVVPIICSVIIGIGATWVTLKTTIATVDVRLIAIESEVKNLRLTYEILTDMRVEKATLETKLNLHIEQASARDKRLDELNKRILSLEARNESYSR